VGYISKVRCESPEEIFTEPIKDLMPLLQEGIGQSQIALVFSGEGATPVEEYSKTRCIALVLPRKHLDPHSVKPAALSFINAW